MNHHGRRINSISPFVASIGDYSSNCGNQVLPNWKVMKSSRRILATRCKCFDYAAFLQVTKRMKYLQTKARSVINQKGVQSWMRTKNNTKFCNPSFSFGKREDPGDEFFLESNMASSGRLGVRLCFRVCMSAHHHTRYRTLISNSSSYLWRYRLSSGINTVGTIPKNWKFYFGFLLTTCIPMLTLTLNNI